MMSVDVAKHQRGKHDQAAHGAWAKGSLRNQDEPMNPETAWVHQATWYHGTSRPDLDVLDARGRARYPATGTYYAISGNNFATTDKELAARYAREAADMDIAAGVEGVRPTVYRVVPTSDYFDPDPHSGPNGWNDGPADMNEAFELYDNGVGVSVRFQDVMDIAGAFDAETGEELSVKKMLEMLKHQRGKHDQSAHGAWAKGSGLREGWSQRSKDQILAEFQGHFRSIYPNDREHADNMAEEFASWTTKYDGPNGTTVTVDLRSEFGGDTSPDSQTMDTALRTLDRLQAQNPVKDLQVEFSDKPFRDEADLVPQGASGFVIRGEKKINMRPRLATDIGMSQVRDDGHFMPAAENVSRVEYYLTHEYGHILDTRTRSRVIEDSLELEDMGALDIGEMSDYGLTNDHEIFAESYAEWSLTEGATENTASQYLAKKYFWGENMDKAVGEDEVERIIIIDTFEEGNPPSVKPYRPTSAIIKIAPGLQPLLKHQKGKHDQRSHGRRGSVSPFYDELQESQQQAIDYLMGERPFPPGYSEQGVGPMTTTFAGSIMGKISEARDAVREWRAERSARELRDMTPTELAALGAANRARAAKRAAGVRSAGRRSPSEWEGPVPSVWSNPFAAPAMAKSADVMQLLYRLFGDVVDVDVWLALVSDPRPVADIDGPLGDLLDDMLDAATPQSVVIKLAPGLRPVLKHQRGKHDQRSHGVWARGRGGAGGDFSEWGDRAERIRAMQDIGPDLTRVARVFQEIEDGNLDEIVEQRVLEDYSELIEERITRNREQIESLSEEGVVEAFGTPAEQFVSALEAQGQSRSEAIEKFREMKLADVERQVKAQAQIDYGYEVRQGIADDLRDRIEPGIREVMEISHPVSIYGTADHVNTTVTVVSVDGIDSGKPVVTIKGTLTNDDGISVGHEWHRELRLAEDSTSAAPKLEAENKYLKLTDEDYQRQGFATTFNERAYDMYIANGMDTVKVGTAWDGGSVWAKRGFDWDDNHERLNMSVARDALNSILYDPDVPARSRERAANMLADVNNASGVRDVDMPTPMEIVMLGYQPGVSEWAGYRALFDARWQGEKTLTPTNVAETRSRKDELKVIARQEREVAGQKKLFVPSRESTVGGTIGEPVDVTTGQILDLLEPVGGVPRVRTPEGAAKYGKPIGAPIRAVEKKMSRLDKLQAQMDFYEKWLEETNRELEDDDLAFFAAAAEAMPWLVD